MRGALSRSAPASMPVWAVELPAKAHRGRRGSRPARCPCRGGCGVPPRARRKHFSRADDRARADQHRLSRASEWRRRLQPPARSVRARPRRRSGREGRGRLKASVLGPQGKVVSELHVAFAPQANSTAATPCGPGCYRATAATSGRRASVQLEVGGRLAVHWRVALPAAWPPPDETALIASSVWRSLQSLSFSETLCVWRSAVDEDLADPKA